MSGSRLARGGFLIYVGCFSELKYIDAQFIAAVKYFVVDLKHPDTRSVNKSYQFCTGIFI